MKVNNYPLKTPSAGDKLFGSDSNGDQKQFDMSNFGATTYKVYTALLSQVGTSAPVATVLENTLGGTPTFSYVGIGSYEITLSGAFLANKTWIIGGSANISAGSGDFATLDIVRFSDNVVRLKTYDNFTPLDDMLVLTPIEIRVYN